MDDEPVTIDHVHQYAYCPRRMHLMYVDGRWGDNVFTEEGRSAHARLDAADDVLPEAPADVSADSASDAAPSDPEPVVARSVMLSSDGLGLVGKLDLVELDGGEALPVDTKRGHPPDNPWRCYEPERVQLMAQALLLREHGFACARGMLYFAGARRRVLVELSPELEARTVYLLREAQALAKRRDPPPPLSDSPKCVGCSLAGLCLPDEINYLDGRTANAPGDLRRLYPARDDALPLYVQEQGARVGKEGECVVVVRRDEKLGRYPLKDVAQLVLCGNIGVSAQALHLLCESGVPVVHLSMGGWFYGITHGHGLRNAYDRAAQFAAAGNEAQCLAFARAVTETKILNQRTMLRRNAQGDVDESLQTLKRQAERAAVCDNAENLLGVEGAAAAAYFGAFARMLRADKLADGFVFADRNRRPPRDPVNALLSFAYALLVKECTVALMSEGLDPWWGFYHRPRHGRPALALDLMEEFRPLVADSAVLSCINTGMAGIADFEVGASGCCMKPAARKAILRAYEQRLDDLMTHPVFDYRCSWRAVVRLQARLLAKWLRGDIDAYKPIATR